LPAQDPEHAAAIFDVLARSENPLDRLIVAYLAVKLAPHDTRAAHDLWVPLLLDEDEEVAFAANDMLEVAIEEERLTPKLAAWIVSEAITNLQVSARHLRDASER
jgi:hypothetical protein